MKKNLKMRPSASPTHPFSLGIRLPGWLPDRIEDTGTIPKITEVLFPEEILEKKGGYLPFSHPRAPWHAAQSDATAAFLEPGSGGTSGTDGDWNNFNKWILGSAIIDANDESNKLFNRWLRDLCRRIRNYNWSLYRLRRAHIVGGTGPLPEMPPLPNETASAASVADVEKGWEDAVEQLLAALSTKFTNDYGECLPLCDMVEVNNYIVSVRVVTVSPNNAGVAVTEGQTPKRLQVGGSSSSHVSVSSAFSSQQP